VYACPAHVESECIHRPNWWQDGGATFWQITLDTFVNKHLHLQDIASHNILLKTKD